MKHKPAVWEEKAPGVKVLKLWETDLNPDWPRVVMLDLTVKRFNEFDGDPLGFAQEYELYPDQPILWMTPCAKPPVGKGIPKATESSRWLVVINHGHESIATSAACPQTTTTTP